MPAGTLRCLLETNRERAETNRLTGAGPVPGLPVLPAPLPMAPAARAGHPVLHGTSPVTSGFPGRSLRLALA